MGAPFAPGSSKLLSRPTFLVIVLVASIASDTKAFGYVDPGSGTLIWQFLVAGIAGVLFYAQSLFRSLFSSGKKRRNTPKDAQAEASPPPLSPPYSDSQSDPSNMRD